MPGKGSQGQPSLSFVVVGGVLRQEGAPTKMDWSLDNEVKSCLVLHISSDTLAIFSLC